MEPVCRYCEGEIVTDRANILRGFARCPACDGITRFPVRASGRLHIAPLPNGVEIKRDETKPYIVYRWLSRLLILADFIMFTTTTVLDGILSPKAGPYVFVVRDFCFIVGIYAGAVIWYNATEIRVTGSVLSLKHGPLPWKRNRTIQVDDIGQLYCARRRSRSIKYEVRLRLANGSYVEILSCYLKPDKALFIAQAIEEFLGIED